MSNELLEAIETVLPTLEAIREEIIQQAVTKANRPALDKAYVAVVDAMAMLEKLREGSTVYAR